MQKMRVSTVDSPTVLFMPQFVAKALTRNNGSLSSLVNGEKMDTKISINYLAYIFCLNTKIKNILDTSENQAIFKDDNNNYSVAMTLATDKSICNELDAIFNVDKNENVEDTFIIYDTQSNNVCVGIKEGFDFNNQKQLLCVVKAVIKQWYLYEKQETVACSALFKVYLKLLSAK